METVAVASTAFSTVERARTRAGVLARVAVALAPLVVAAGQLRFLNDNAVPVGDEATLELAMRSALAGRQLLGPWSRYGENSGWFHPGPIMYYLLAPFYALSGRRHAGLAIGALVVAALSLVAVVAVVGRRFGDRYAIAAAIALVIFEWRFGIDQLRSSWNPLIVIAPLIVVIVAAQTIRPSSRRWLPLAIIGFGSIAVQSHVGTLPVVAVMLLVALVSSVRSRRQFVQQWGLAIAAGLVLWLPPLIEQLPKGRRGNLALIVRHFITVGRRGDRSNTPTLIARAITLHPTHVGRWFGPEGSWNPLPAPTRTMWFTLLICPVLIVALVSWGRSASRRVARSRLGVAVGSRFVAPVLAVGAGALGLLLATDPPPPYLATPLIAAAVALWITIAASAVDLVADVAGWRSPGVRTRSAALVLAPFVLVPFVASPSITAEAFRSFASSDRVTTPAMSQIAAALAPVCADRSHDVTIGVDGAAWSAALGAGVALQRCGKRVEFSSNLHHLVGDRYARRDGAVALGAAVWFLCPNAPVPDGARHLATVTGISADDSATIAFAPDTRLLPGTAELHACP